MEIGVHLIDGEVYRFSQEDPALVAGIFSKIHPKRLFLQQQIMIHGKLAVSGFSTLSIEYITLKTDVTPSWPATDPNLKTIQRIDKDTYSYAVDQLARHLRDGRPETKPGEAATGYMEMVLTSGRKLHMMYEIVTRGKIDALMTLQNFLEPGGFLASGLGGGYCLINPANISRYLLSPGPAQTPAQAWCASRLGESLSDRMSSEGVDTSKL